ncbi:MAG: DNA photolyase [Syntrophobacterales bacterium]|nr:MAG: DNA photolyase [Syntrophobacterales bacterium]
MARYELRRIFLDRGVVGNPVADGILSKAGGIPVTMVNGIQEATRRLSSFEDSIGEGKHSLLITRQKGEFVKKCPGTHNRICCRYYIINLVVNCPIDCSYCILQGYLNNPAITIYVNIDDLFAQMEEKLSSNSGRIFRLGTGELGDSLAFDEMTHFSTIMVPFFSNKENGIFELKTKTEEVGNLLDLDHRGKTVISWSVNPEKVVEEEELNASTLARRLDAARKCQQRGYHIGLHFDPLIYCPEWERDYREVIEKVFEKIDGKGIIWVSLGGFRFPPYLKPIIGNRFPASKILLGELFPGNDGKLRYLKSIRVGMYREIVRWLREYEPSLFIYLCMESREVWEKVFGWSPKDNKALDNLFAHRVRSFTPMSQ